jgi:hypothetical protein
MTSLPITYLPAPPASHKLQHVVKFRISDSPKFPELADFQRLYEEKELIEAENEARERKKIIKPPAKKISDFAQQMKEEKEPLNHYDREAIFSHEQSALNQEYLCSVTSNAFRVDVVDPAAGYRKPKPEPAFVQFVAIVHSDSIQLTPVTGNLYEAKRRPSTTGRRNLDRRQHDGEREKKDANEMLRALGAHRKIEAHDKDVNKYMAFGSADDTAENNVDDIHRRIDIDSNDLDMDVGEGHDAAGFEPVNADVMGDQIRDEALHGEVNLDVDNELERSLFNPDAMEDSVKAADEKKTVRKKNRSELPATIESKLRAGSLSVDQAKKWMKQLLDEFDVNKDQLTEELKKMAEYRGAEGSKELMLKQSASVVANAAKKQRK